MRRTVLAASLVVLLLVAGCSGLGSDGETTTAPTPSETTTPAPDATATPGGDDGTTEAEPTTEATSTSDPDDGGDENGENDAPADPESDVIGWENGYWYNESVDADSSDGLNETEFEAVKYRTMARVERVRDREFTRDVTFEFVTLEEFRENSPFGFGEDRVRDQYWRALHVVGDDRTSAAALNDLYDVVVDGYYSPGRIVVVVDDPESPGLGTGVLAHELAHALDFQTVPNRERPTNRDQREASRAVSEGSANLVERMYRERCETEWDCIERPPESDRDYDDEAVNDGLYARFSLAYSVGEEFVSAVYERGGWDAVDEAMRSPPASTEQIVHPERYPDDEPATVEVPDRSNDEWNPVGSRIVGEATLYVSLWHNDAIEGPDVEVTQAQRTGLPYTHPAVDGWDGDSLVVYANGDAYGHVFATEWATADDAAAFRDAYVSMLTDEGATEVEPGVYRVPAESEFAGAYRVAGSGDRLVIVHAPTIEGLSAVHAANASAA